jgi:hypothetical protein
VLSSSIFIINAARADFEQERSASGKNWASPVIPLMLEWTKDGATSDVSRYRIDVR